jgi:cytochrome c-type biogenesis protein CcmH
MRAILAALLVAYAAAAFGQAEEVAHPDPRVEARLKDLGEELRCLVCQNQTIADSAAPLAQDLRNQIRAQIAQGKSDDEIRAYMVDRYGDFVLYRPPFKAITALLWVGPFALLALGIAILAIVLRRRRRVPPAPAPDADAERARIAALLEGDRAPPGASKG